LLDAYVILITEKQGENVALTLRNQIKNTKSVTAGGFALPTILIASIVMLTVLLVSVTSTTALRVAINGQYYSQLAQLAGEAGTAYATACLHNNSNTPSWSDAKPLTPNTDCSGNVQGSFPTYIMTNASNVRSGFSIGMPTVDAFGHATTVANNGFSEITRESNGAVWRHYNQPAVQSAVVPDQCSGTATSTLGWSMPYVYTSGLSFPEGSAQVLSTSNAYAQVGPAYFRKDFTVTSAATYNVYNQADDRSDLYIDGQLLSTVNYPNTDTKQITLSVGCHTIISKLTNASILINPAGFRAAVIKVGSSVPTVVTDTSWRFTAGVSRHFSEVNYYADPGAWTAARDTNPATYNPGWAAATGDPATRDISTTHSYDGSGNYPSNAYAMFRDNRTVTVTSPTQVKIAYVCDDSCSIYMDGNVISTGTLGPPQTATLTLPEGSHKFAVALYNGSGPSYFSFIVVRYSDGAVLTSTDTSWSAANFWTGLFSDINNYSYDNTFFPTPDPRTINTLIVAGGGSGGGATGGGGGAGGVISTLTGVTAGSYPVVVGSGGIAPGNQNPGISGTNSSFNGLVAIGGGGGAASRNSVAASSSPGGSGGGSQNYNGSISIAGLGTPLQGNPGGPLGNSGSSGGGGAGGSGSNTEGLYIGGNGGIGIQSSISGISKYYAGGGAGGNGGTGGLGGGGNGADIGTAGTANTGGGGGGGWGYGTGNGGAGGSGVVIISYPTGSITATGGTITTSGGYTIHTFTSSGVFTVSGAASAGVNIAPPISKWALASGATYNAGAGTLSLTPTGTAATPLIFVGQPTTINVGGDFFATVASANGGLAPNGGYHMGIYYYGSDGVTPALNSAGYTSNGCAQPVTLYSWNLAKVSCNFSGGPNVYYVTYAAWGSSSGYASSDLLIKNPILTIN
jgi:hypothetical protein